MGMGMFRGCSLSPSQPAPNPDPSRWIPLARWQYKNAYVLKVRYLDCTNFEGVKVMVYRGQFTTLPTMLDPHFSESWDSPIARFKPDAEGIGLAKMLAESL